MALPEPVPNPPAQTTYPGTVWVAWGLTWVGLVYAVESGLVPALLAGLLVYQLVRLLVPFWVRMSLPHARYFTLSHQAGHWLALVSIVSVIIIALVGFTMLMMSLLHTGSDNLTNVFARLAEVLASSRAMLPAWVTAWLPIANGEMLRNEVVHWLQTHAHDLSLLTGQAGKAMAHVLIGMIIGGLVAIREPAPDSQPGPLAVALMGRIERLGDAFRQVVFAQVRISLLNTALTALYLGMVLPWAGIHLPFTKTLIALTFLTGLLPIVGNLMSNSVIFILSLAHSPAVALGSLAYLVLIHKLEYFVNARIIGQRINAAAWELLLAMLVLEHLFGLSGLIMAPVLYAYLKAELTQAGWV